MSFELDPVVQDVALALGICTPQGSGAALNTAFFSDPWRQVRGIFANGAQRAALVSALGRLLATGEPLLRPEAGAGPRNAYPLLQPDAPGQIYLVVTRDGPATAAAMRLSVLAEVAVAGGGPAAELEIALVAADANGIRPVAASRAHPLRVEASVPVSADGARLVASLLLVADPLDASRLRVRLTGLAEPAAEIEVDVLAATPPMAQLVSLLLHLLLAQIDTSAPIAVRRAAAAVPTLLGLVPGLPPLPVGELARDIGAMRRWLAALFTGRTPSGDSTLVVWFGAIGKLLGAPDLPQPLPQGTPEDPVLLPLLAPADNVPGISLSAAVRREASDGSHWLVIGLRAQLVASGVADAALRADATVLALPLAGTAPATVLERLDLRLDATASGAPLVDAAAHGGFGVRALRAGLSLRPQPGGAPPQVVPLLELLDVSVLVAGSARQFARLDLTDAGALGDAAEAVLGDLLDQALPGAAAVAQALRTLLGLGRTPGLDTALLASAPTRAIGSYYRALRATPNGWQPVLQALAVLLGDATAPTVAGSGRPDDPWTVPIAKFAAPSTAPAGAMALQLALWDSGDVATPVFTLALRAAGQVDTVGRARLDVQLIEAALQADGQGAVRWLGGITAGVRLLPPSVQPTLDGISLRVDGARLDAHWRPAQPITVAASLDGLRLVLDEETVDLGALRLPLPAGGLDPTAADLGLGLDAAALWRALQTLLAQRAVALGGAQAGALLALVGLAQVQGPGGAVRLPPLPLPAGGLPALLADPLAAVRAWLAALLAQGSTRDAALAWVQQLAHLLADSFGLDADALPAIPGGGSPQDPWALRLGDDSAALAATLWLAPAGPPRAWAAPTLAQLAADDLTAEDVLAAADALRGHAPWLGPALHGHAPATAAAQLQALDAALAGSDGLLPLGLATPIGDAWTLGTPVMAAHHRLPRHPEAVAQVRARIATLTAGLPAGGWTVLLLAPPLAGADCWDALLQGVPAAEQARASLRVPGIAPELVDLQALPVANWLVLDTADDGSGTRAKARQALERVVDAVLRVRPGARLVLVGHSYCGLVARAVAARRAQAVAGLITLAAPVGAGDPLALDDAARTALGPAARLLQALAPNGLDAATAPALAAAVALLADQLQGGAAPGVDAARPPLSAWRRPPGMGPLPATLPALNIVALAGDAPLCTALARTLVRDVQALPLPAAPTHLCWGLRLGLALPAAVAGEVQVDARLGLALGSVAFASGQVQAGAGALDFQARLQRPGGWLLGGPGAGAVRPASVRWMAVSGVLPAGATQAQIGIALHDASLQRRVIALATLDDAATPGLLDLLVRTLDSGLASGGPLDSLLDLLATLGMVRRRTSTAPAAVLADGLQALRDDAMARLRAALPALLDAAGGLLGWQRAPGALATGGPWLRTLAPLPVECLIETAPWRIRVRTTGDGLALGPTARLQLDASVPLGGGAVRCSAGLVLPGATLSCAGAGQPLQLQLAGMAAPVALAPSDPNLGRVLAEAVPTALMQAALSLLLEQSLQGTARIAPLGRLLRDPGGWLADTLSNAASALQPSRVQSLLQALAALVGLQTDTGAVLLPGGLRLSAADVGGRLRLALASAAPIALWDSGGAPATLDLGLQLDIDAQRQPTPGGALRLRLPLPAPSPWGVLDIAFGADAQGLRLQVGTDTGIAVQLLPQVAGLDTLLSGAITVGTTQLLPMVLDRLAAALHTAQPRPAALDDALAVATALGLHDAGAAIGSGFAARAQAIGAFAQQVATGQLQALAPAIGTALATLLGRLFGANVTPATGPGQVGLTLAGVSGGSLAVGADFSHQPIGLFLRLQDVTLGAVRLSADLGLVLAGTQTTLQASLSLSAAIDTGAGLVLQPGFAAGLQIGADVRSKLDFLPLPDGTARIALAPQPTPPTPADLLKLAEAWLLPLAGTLLLREADAVLSKPLWTGATNTIGDLLVAAGLAARESDGRLRMLTPLPTPLQLLRGLLDGLAGAQVPLPGDLALALVTDARQRYGVALRGAPKLGIGDYALTLHMGLPTAMSDAMQWPGADGLGLLLLDMSNAAQPAFNPVLRLGGLGARFGKADATKPLIDVGGFRLGTVGAYLAADLELMGANAPRLAGQTPQDQRVLGAVELTGLGLVIAPGGNDANPVAGSLVKSDGAGGDSAPANPPFDLMVGSPAQAGGGITVRFGGEPALRIAIRKQFGPLYLEEIALLYQQRLPGLGLIGIGLDASIALAGLKVQADGLSLYVPIDHPGELERWELDLSGLAVSYQGSGLKIMGGLLKAQLPTTIEYRGSLSVEVAGYGLSAIGAYARPTDAAGEYTSLFIFLAVSAPLGGPPYLFITGVAAGAGVNRRLLTPRDPAAVPGFPLVAAMTPGADPDPMTQLQRIGTDIPPQRGAFWLAAGIKFSTFELLKTTALVTVAVDRGFEISLMGLMQLQLPPVEEAAILSVELALAAKYSTVDQVLSIQAGLTRNSWLISRDCQLTGGFAFVAWFDPARPGVLLTIGGYSANFDPPDFYPVVPRVGFHWNLAIADVPAEIVIKGETFFALTHAAAMVGGALEVSFKLGPVRAWFSTMLDVIIWWDPFAYQVDAHIEIGIELKLEACAFGICVSLPALRISQGAWLHLEGPPLSGSVLVDVGVARFTIPFGQTVPQEFRTWPDVVATYLAPPPAQGATGATATAGSVGAGGLPAPQQASGPTDGSFERPWHVAPEFALRVESKMPLAAWRLEQRAEQGAGFGPGHVLAVPCGPQLGGMRAVLQLGLGRPAANGVDRTPLPGAQLDAMTAQARPGSFPTAVWSGPNHDFDAPADAAQDMLQALGGMELRSRVALLPSVAPADLVLSGLVEEEAALGLPFPPAPTVPVMAPRALAGGAGAQAGGSDGAAKAGSAGGDSGAGGAGAPAAASAASARTAVSGRSVRSSPPAAPAATAKPPRAPKLVAQLPAPIGPLPQAATSRSASRSASRAPARARAAAAPAEGSAPLAAGAAQLWQLAGDTPHALQLRGAPRRLTAIAGSGAVLADVHGAVGSQALPAGTAAVLVSDALDDGPAGWELATPLLQAGRATLVAPGACLLLPRPWQAPARPGDTALPRRVTASALTADIDGITTRFEGAPTSLLLRLDRHLAGARIDQVGVAVQGATLGERQVIRHGTRVELLYALRPHAGEAVAVTVQRGEGWRLAGVLAGRRVHARWAHQLFDERHCRLASPATPAAATALTAASVALRATTPRRKT